MSDPEQTLQSLPFKDRRGRLIAGGILQIIAGVCCAFGFAFSFLGMLIVNDLADESNENFLNISLLFGLCLYTVAALWFIIMGLGSLSMRRWARALTLAFAWISLVEGTTALLGMAIFMPKMLQAMTSAEDLPANMVYISSIIGILVPAFLYIVYPGILVLLYSGKDVKRTCEYYNPLPCWTDRRPLPILAASLILCLHPFHLLFMVIPLQKSDPAVLLLVPLAILVFFALAWGFYRLYTPAWWGAILASPLLLGLAVFIYSRIDYTELFQSMGVDEKAFGQMGTNAFMDNSGTWMSTALMAICIWGFLLYTKRYFKKPGTPPVVTDIRIEA